MCDGNGVSQKFVNGITERLSFFSKKLSPAVTKYSTFDRELLAIYLSMFYTFSDIFWRVENLLFFGYRLYYLKQTEVQDKPDIWNIFLTLPVIFNTYRG